MVGDAEPGVRRGVLADEADLGPLGVATGGPRAEHLDLAGRRRQHAHGQVEEGALAGAVGTDQPDHPAGGDLQGAVGERPLAAVLLAQARGPAARCSCGLLAVAAFTAERKVARNSASMLSSSSPARRALASHCSRLSRSGPWAARVLSVSVRVTKVPTPWPRRHQPLVLELAVGLEHGVGVDGEVPHDVLDRRQLVALAEQAEPERAADLLDQLEVRRDPGPPVQVELDHRLLYSSR